MYSFITSPQLWHNSPESSHRPSVNKEAWLCANKALFRNAGAGSDGPALLCLGWLCLRLRKASRQAQMEQYYVPGGVCPCTHIVLFPPHNNPLKQIPPPCPFHRCPDWVQRGHITCPSLWLVIGMWCPSPCIQLKLWASVLYADLCVALGACMLLRRRPIAFISISKT